MKQVKRVHIVADVEVDDSFDINDIAIGKYIEANQEIIILPRDADFRVVDYIQIFED